MSPDLKRINCSPFQLPPRTPFDNSVDQQLEPDPFPESSHVDEHFVFSPLQEKPVETIENINDENFGRKLIIEKHLEHQMMLKKQTEAHSPLLQKANYYFSSTTEQEGRGVITHKIVFAVSSPQSLTIHRLIARQLLLSQ